MGDKSKIEWTDATWNPVTGCTKVSQGCKNCYAERLWPKVEGARVKREGNEALGEPRPFIDVRTHPERLDVPLNWKKPRRIFVNSMSDLFHEAVPHGFIVSVFSHMEAAPQHTFQILTKRPENMLHHFRGGLIDKFPVLPNVHLGVSVEDQPTADERISLLLKTPAAVRFVSYEPALGPVETKLIWTSCKFCGAEVRLNNDCVASGCSGMRQPQRHIDWVIVGGESGPKARPPHPDWFRSMRDQCAAAGVPFFFKQWGEWAPQPEIQSNDWVWMTRVGKKAAGAMLDGREWKDFPK